MNTTIAENLLIHKTAQQLRQTHEEQGRRDKILDDMAGLKVEIIDRIGFLFPLLVKYLSLLEQEQYKHDPMSAYLMGKASRERGVEYSQGFTKYLNGAESAPDARQLEQDIQRYYSTLLILLGDNSGLLSELTELYRQTYGCINRHIDVFFRMGYES